MVQCNKKTFFGSNNLKSMNTFLIILIKLICLFALLLSFKFPKKYYIIFKCCLKYFQYYHYLNKKCLNCPKEIMDDLYQIKKFIKYFLTE